jgi:flagellar hook-basal body complex protein FliE
MVGAISSLQSAGVSRSIPHATSTTESTDSFSSLISRTGADAVSKLKAAESLSVQALTGDVAVREVASAVMAAEQTLQLSMSVRDKIVSAYLELSRMQI